ncbi:MAG: serine--tRNA ligase [Dehalococcoidia bacterium]|nr:serine--tRNA ligase [Dehalococcoidia bacterium]
MNDLRFIREHPDAVREALAHRRDDSPLDELLQADSERRELLGESEALKARRNEVSRQIGRMKDRGAAASTIEEMRKVGSRIAELDREVADRQDRIEEIMLWMPNLPHESVPVGSDDDDNTIVHTWGTPRTFDFEPLPHWELGERLGILDLPRAAKLSGAMFTMLRGAGARLSRALITWMLDLHVEQHGYTEIAPAHLVRREVMVGTGQLPRLEDDSYRVAEDDTFLIPTAEVPVTNLHRDEILGEADLPLYYAAYTPCYRREAGAAGKDTRGMLRVHQFDKVEMVKIVAPEDSYAELESLLANAEAVLQALDLPYRVAEICTGDLGAQCAKTYDLEVWSPGVEQWLEVSSCSNCEAYQARRMGTRLRRTDRSRRGPLEHVHTLNGSGLALPRTIISLLEHYQQRDGSVAIPDGLRSYMGGMEFIAVP